MSVRATRAEDGYDERLTRHCLSVFATPVPSDGGAEAADGAASAPTGKWAIDERKLMRSRAQVRDPFVPPH